VGVGFIGLGNYGTGVLSPAFKAAGAAKGAVVPSGGGRGPFRWEAHSVGRQGIAGSGEVAAQSEGCMGSLFVARMRGQVLNRRIPARAKGSPLGGRARVVSEGERE
jgi:hypothetical protein